MEVAGVYLCLFDGSVMAFDRQAIDGAPSSVVRVTRKEAEDTALVFFSRTAVGGTSAQKSLS